MDKAAAAALRGLNGRQPIQLVVQRSQRQALLDAVKGPCGRPPVWRVDPALERAVETAIVEYNRVRAPLYPLPTIQRLGHSITSCWFRFIHPARHKSKKAKGFTAIEWQRQLRFASGYCHCQTH